MALVRLHTTIEKLMSTERGLERKAEELLEEKSKADRASRQKSNFLANMSHEFRTPMTAIIGYGDLLTRPDISSEKRIEWAEQVRRNADHLLGLVNNVLDLSKIESGMFKPDISSCKLDDLISDVYAMMRPLAEAKDLQFNIQVIGSMPLTIDTDSLKLRQVLVNLISNALKFTDVGSVDIHLCSSANIDTKRLVLIIKIEDTGTGIAEDALEQIFEPFTQTRSIVNINMGTGLGLSISQGIAKMLGGGIEVKSELGRGSLFTLRIDCGPLDKTVCVAPKYFDLYKVKPRERATSLRRLDNLTIHVVEDSLAIKALVRHLLKEAGAEVRQSANGKEAVESILTAAEQDRLPDLILMDMLMPVMDGYTAATCLRQAGIKTPIVAMTAFAFMDDREKCLASGCDVYISKPINPANFIEQLSVCIHCEKPSREGPGPGV
jgi:two-component system CheB/CheR fusion protein